VPLFYVKHILYELVLTDLKPHVIYFQYCSYLLYFVDSLIYFIMIFVPFGISKQFAVIGYFKSITMFSNALSCVSLMIQWSHIVDL